MASRMDAARMGGACVVAPRRGCVLWRAVPAARPLVLAATLALAGTACSEEPRPALQPPNGAAVAETNTVAPRPSPGLDDARSGSTTTAAPEPTSTVRRPTWSLLAPAASVPEPGIATGDGPAAADPAPLPDEAADGGLDTGADSDQPDRFPWEPVYWKRPPQVERDEPGPLYLTLPPKFDDVAYQILDLCDDRQALAAIYDWVLPAGEVLWTSDLRRIEEERRFQKVSCDAPPGESNRYVAVGETAVTLAKPTPEEAVAVASSWSSPSLVRLRLGYGAPPEYDVESPVDEVVVLSESVHVREGALRGLVQNKSEELYARGVAVSIGGRRHEFPLTVQPGEVVPFVIDDYEDTTAPAPVAFDVEATLSPAPDPLRSFVIYDIPTSTGNPYIQYDPEFPDFIVDEIPDVEFRHWVHDIELVAPSSHPSLADEVTTQAMDLIVYLTSIDPQGRVLDVEELVPFRSNDTVDDDGEFATGWAPISTLPYTGSSGVEHYGNFYVLYLDVEGGIRWELPSTAVLTVGGVPRSRG